MYNMPEHVWMIRMPGGDARRLHPTPWPLRSPGDGIAVETWSSKWWMSGGVYIHIYVYIYLYDH